MKVLAKRSDRIFETMIDQRLQMDAQKWRNGKTPLSITEFTALLMAWATKKIKVLAERLDRIFETMIDQRLQIEIE